MKDLSKKMTVANVRETFRKLFEFYREDDGSLDFDIMSNFLDTDKVPLDSNGECDDTKVMDVILDSLVTDEFVSELYYNMYHPFSWVAIKLDEITSPEYLQIPSPRETGKDYLFDDDTVAFCLSRFLDSQMATSPLSPLSVICFNMVEVWFTSDCKLLVTGYTCFCCDDIEYGHRTFLYESDSWEDYNTLEMIAIIRLIKDGILLDELFEPDDDYDDNSATAVPTDSKAGVQAE